MKRMSLFWVCLIFVRLVEVGWAVVSGPPCPQSCSCDADHTTAVCKAAASQSLPSIYPPTLLHLNMANNSLTTLWTSNITFPELHTLDLSHNLIPNLNFLQYVFMPKLQRLNVNSNLIHSISQADIAMIPQIKQLQLSDNLLDRASLDIFSNAKSLKSIDLSQNYITDLGDVSLQNYMNLSHILSLNLAFNSISQLQPVEWNSLINVQTLNLSFNLLTSIQSIDVGSTKNKELRGSVTLLNNSAYDDYAMRNETFLHPLYSTPQTKNIQVLDLSNNQLNTMDSHALQYLYNLKVLYLQINKLPSINPVWFEALSSLETLQLSANPLEVIPGQAFINCSQLQYLVLSDMPNLTYVHYEAFLGMNMLTQLILSDNPLLHYLHASTLSHLLQLETLDIRNDAIETLYPDLFSEVDSLQTVYMSGNKFKCDCDFEWIHEWITKYNNTMPHFHEPDSTYCSSPAQVSNQSINKLGNYNFSCSGAQIIQKTNDDDTYFRVGGSGVLNCVVTGSPQPRITWYTPRGNKVLHYPAFINWLRPGPHHHTFHANHPWHDQYYYDKNVPHSERIYILSNGSLYIDYMLRNDAGTYSCTAQNPYGNSTVVIHLKLDYTCFKMTEYLSLAVGFSCAMAFFFIAVLIAAIRYIAYFCSRSQREKRKSIREILGSLEQYRLNKFDQISAYKSEKIDKLSQYKSEKIDRLSQYKSEKIDRLSAYKTEKFDKLSAYKTAKFDQLTQFRAAKVEQLRTYKSFNFTTLVHYIKGMREHYLDQVMKIKENCTQQSDKLKENYTNKACAFKDYRSTKLDSLRENYVAQVMKVKEYGSSQMVKLREQYKIQQNYVLKLIEIMDIGNCMTIVEEECMRTESMLLDPAELDLDFDTHPVHLLPEAFHSDEESNYETAGSHLDVRNQDDDMHNGKVKKAQDFTEIQKPRKIRKHKHKRPINVQSFDDGDDESVKQAKRRRRKTRREKILQNNVADSDTPAPETPPEVRHPITATIHNENETKGSEVASSEYESAAASHSREQTPDTPLSGAADVGQTVLAFTNPQLSNPTVQVNQEVNTPENNGECEASTPMLTDEDHIIAMDTCNKPPKTDTQNMDESTV